MRYILEVWDARYSNWIPRDDLKSLLDRSVDVLSEKRADEQGNFRSVLFESEVSGVEQMQFRAGRIFQERLRARLGKYWIVLTPDNQHCRLVLPQVLVPR